MNLKNKGIIGILTGGGDVPGLNPAIRAVTIRALREGYNLNPWFVGALVAIATAVVIIGGVKRIAAYSEWLVPIMGGMYLLLAVVVISMNLEKIPEAIVMVFKGAFTGKAALGGAMGVGILALIKAMIPAISAGVTRAVLA